MCRMSMDDLECPVSRLPLLAGILGFWDLAQRRALLSIIALMMGDDDGDGGGGWVIRARVLIGL